MRAVDQRAIRRATCPASQFAWERLLRDRAIGRVTFPLAEDIGVDDDRFVDLFKPDIKPLAAARPIELLRSQYLRDLSDEDAAGSTTEAVVGVGQALAGSGEGARVRLSPRESLSTHAYHAFPAARATRTPSPAYACGGCHQRVSS